MRILLADDHPLFRRGLRDALDAEEDLEVVAEASDGAEAVELALAHDVELALLDVMMPRMTGVQAAEELRRRRPAIRVLMLSSFEGEQHIADAHKAGAGGYLFKSAHEDEVIAACRAVMRGEAVFPERFATDGRPRDALTAREVEVLKLVAEGWSSQRIADALVISVNTVDRHRQNLLEKLGVHDRVELTRYAIRRGLVEP